MEIFMNMKTGDILVCKWGYEQTNVDFYQIIKTTAAMVTIRKIEANETYENSTMTGHALPVKDSFTETPIRRKVSFTGHEEHIAVEPYSLRISGKDARSFTVVTHNTIIHRRISKCPIILP
jgi:hypothetical protein